MRARIFLAVLCALPPAAAAAGTRDDVVQGIVRCGAIADDRQWLDCIYGAAQPMRARLGLTPAPQAQQRLVPAQGYGTLPGYGGSAPQPAFAPVPVAPAAAVTTASAAPPTQRVTRTDRDFFDKLVGTANVPTVTTRMQSYQFDRQGLFTVTLINGQNWRQLPDSTDLAHWSKPPGSYTVTIKPGAFGSFNLVVNDEARLYKVKRVK